MISRVPSLMNGHNGTNGGNGWVCGYERLLRQSLSVVKNMLNETDRRILSHLHESPSCLDYVSRISKATGISYMTTKRCIVRLSRTHLVKRHENRSNSYSYYELTEIGIMLVQNGSNGCIPG